MKKKESFLYRRSPAGHDLCDACGWRRAGSFGRCSDDRQCGRSADGGAAPVPDDLMRLFPWPDPDRIPVKQCGRGDLHADCDPACAFAWP